jgi:NADH:ubiquinone reductase (H+-translocating)
VNVDSVGTEIKLSTKTQLSPKTKHRVKHRVVVIGGGFGGLYAAKRLGASRKVDVDVTLVDKRNFHLFQPLLYQVATGTVSPADISSPLRSVLSKSPNTQVMMDEVVDLDPHRQVVMLKSGELGYDSLIVATGVSHHYFGNEQWQSDAPGLKTVEDALEIRRRIFLAFEAAEKESDPAQRRAYLTFVVVGGGPTGVELAGAIAELAFTTLKRDFRKIDTSETQVILLEGLDRVLPPYPPELSAAAEASLTQLGVTVQTKALVTDISNHVVTLRQGETVSTIPSRTILWAAGVKASAMGKTLATTTGVELDRVGRVMVQPDFSVPNHPNIYVVGDLAHYAHQADGNPLPGTAAVAMQQGNYLADLLLQRLAGKPELPGFRYTHMGSLAIIGHNKAVADFGKLKLTGPLAWFVWIFVHIYYLIEFDNKLIVMLQWGWNYFTRGRGARLITASQASAAGGAATAAMPLSSSAAAPVADPASGNG